MRLLRWIADTIADRGEHDPLPIRLERAPAAAHSGPGGGEAGGGGYAFRLGVRAGIGGHETARIPVQTRPNPSPHPMLKEIHRCEVAGRTLEAANVHALQEKVSRLLESLAPARTLPLCYFRVPSMDYELPVYEQGGELVSPVIGGPKMKAPDIAGIRRVVCRYLASTGYVNDEDEVIVGAVRPRDLSRVPPAAVLRSLADPGLWLPSVEGASAEGPVVGILGQATELRSPERRRAGAGPAGEEPAPSAPDVVGLLRYVQAELGRTGRTPEPGAIYASEVRPEIWAAAEETLEGSGTRLIAHLLDDEGTRLELAVHRTGAGDVVAALEDRGIVLFLAPGEAALAGVVGRYLVRDEFLRFPDEVEVQAVEAPRAERLEPEAIGGPAPGGAGAGPEPTAAERAGQSYASASEAAAGASAGAKEVEARWS